MFIKRVYAIIVLLALFAAGLGSSTAQARPLEVISVVNADIGTAQSKTTGTTLTINTTTAVAAGDDIFVTMSMDPGPGPGTGAVSVTDSAGNSYTSYIDVTSPTASPTDRVRILLFASFDVNALSSPGTITITHPSITARAATASVFRGLAPTGTFDRSSTNTGASTAPSSGATPLTTQADELLIGVVGTEGPETDTPGNWLNSFVAGPRLGTTGSTIAASNVTVSMGYRVVNATGSYTAAKENIQGRSWSAGIATFRMEVDTTGPSVTVNQAIGQSDPTNSSPINFTAVFSEPINIATFTSADVTLGGTAGATTAVVTEIAPNDGTTFNIAVSGMTGSGTVTASIAANTVQDPAANNNTASTSTDNSVMYDVAALTVTVNQAATQSDPTSASPINFTAVFSKAIDTATFTSGDVTLGGTASGSLIATITQVAPNNDTTFNIAVSGMTGPGTVTASIAANTVQDTVGNNNTASTSTDNTVTFDSNNPIVVTTSLSSSYTTGPSSFTVTFNKQVSNAGGGTATDDVENPANYLLVEDGADGTLDTVSCVGGLQPDDTQVTVNSVSYNSVLLTATVVINGGSPIPAGRYRLFVCGTTSIVDLAGNSLNGGADYTFTFTVQPAGGGGGGGGAGTVVDAKTLPATGFPKGMVTKLPSQPREKSYTKTNLVLEIPALEQKLTILGVPLSDSSWDVTWLGNNVGWLNGSAFPTWAGNTVLTGHVWDAYNQPGPFAGLKTLKYGDQIKIHAWGQIYIYEVRESKLISSQNVKAVLQHEDYDWVTLLSCEYYSPSTGDYIFRRMVRAVLVSVE